MGLIGRLARLLRSQPKPDAENRGTTEKSFPRIDEYEFEHYTEAVERIKQLKRERRHEEVEELLYWCIEFTEFEARSDPTMHPPAPAYYEHLAIVYRKDGRHREEVDVLERYVEVAGNEAKDKLQERLGRARELAS